MFNYLSSRLFNQPPEPPPPLPPAPYPTQYQARQGSTYPPQRYPPVSPMTSGTTTTGMVPTRNNGGRRPAGQAQAQAPPPQEQQAARPPPPPPPRPPVADVPPGRQQLQQRPPPPPPQQQQKQKKKKKGGRKPRGCPEFDRNSAILVEIPSGVGEGDVISVTDRRGGGGGTFMARVPPMAAEGIAGAKTEREAVEVATGNNKRYMMVVPPDAFKFKVVPPKHKRRKKQHGEGQGQGQASTSTSTSSATTSPTSSDSDASSLRRKRKRLLAGGGGTPPSTPVTNHHRSWRRGRPPGARTSRRLKELQESGGSSRRGGGGGGGGGGTGGGNGRKWIYYEKKSSRVGKNYQATDLPVAGSFADGSSQPSESYVSEQLWDPKRADSNALEVDDFMRSLSSESKGLGMIAMHSADYDPARANSIILDMEERADSSSHMGGWIETLTESEKAAFHQAIMSHSRKNFRIISSKVGRNVNTCLKYYYGEFKRHDDYKTLRLLNDLDECQICRDGGVLVYCDNCNNPYHLDCLRPPLSAVPEGDWFCDMCIARGRTRRRDLPSPGKPAHGKRRVVVVAADVPPPQSSLTTLPERLPLDDRSVGRREERDVAVRARTVGEVAGAARPKPPPPPSPPDLGKTAERKSESPGARCTVIYEVVPPVPPPEGSRPGPFRTRPAVFV